MNNAIGVLARVAVRQFVAEAQGGRGPSAVRILAEQREQMRRYWITVYALIASGHRSLIYTLQDDAR